MCGVCVCVPARAHVCVCVKSLEGSANIAKDSMSAKHVSC